ncbi:MAG: NAD(P)/FAD-dependent oxidoreductase [Acidobacteriota bacterium]
MPKVVIVGAGLAGSLLAIYLAKRGIQIEVFEARPDMRAGPAEGGRSINLALSNRGIAALRAVGLDQKVLDDAVPMYGRMIHSIDGETKLLPYSGRPGDHINSVSRVGLNIALIEQAERYDTVQFVFNSRCSNFDIASGEIEFDSGRTIRGDTMIATDGAGSAVRRSMQDQVSGFTTATAFLEHGYKELHIPPTSNGAFAMEPNALHIWPRKRFMMIALPNADQSFTCTLFLARNSEAALDDPSFEALTNPESLVELFEREFPDALGLMPTLSDDFFANPTGDLGVVTCWPWNVGGKALLLGDSAHAMVPFYGQGMNCAFEDVRVLDQLIAEYGDIWETIYNRYGESRKPNTDAIQIMAEDNFREMRDSVSDPVFQRKRELEMRLEQEYPDYFSKYSLVTFREDIPYSVAKEKGEAQDRLLMEISSDGEEIDLTHPAKLFERIRSLPMNRKNH